MSITIDIVLHCMQSFDFVLLQISKNAERGASPVAEEEPDPCLGFAALHRHYALSTAYRIKEEPTNHDILNLQDLLA